MNVDWLFLTLGQFWGRYVLNHGVAYLRRQALKFDVTIIGQEHLLALADQPFLLVSNHIFPNKSELWPLAYLRFFKQYHRSADSFALERVMHEQIGRPLNTIAQAYPGGWSDNPRRRWIQEHVAQPFSLGQMEAEPTYIALQRDPGSYQRRFVRAVAQVMQRREPILIFPAMPGLEHSSSPDDVGAGAAHLARKYHLPILPLYIAGTESWRPGNQVTVTFGEAFSPTGLTKEQITVEFLRRMHVLIASHVPSASSLQFQRNDQHVASI